MSGIGSERYSVQNPIIRYATQVGWAYLERDEAQRLRRGESNPILWDVFIEKAQSLNPAVANFDQAEDLAKQLVRVAPTIEGNLETWELMRGLKTVYVEAEKRERNVRLFDFDDARRNTFHVTDEFRFSNGVTAIRADVVFLINGIPVLIVETKSAKKLEGIAEGLDQVRRYHREGAELLAVLQIFGLTQLTQYYYGATWNTSRKNLFNWKEEIAAADFETLVKAFVQPERILRILRDYILFTRKDDELAKVILRPHQMHAVERALGRAANAKKQRGLVWHTQGSGKTYTMITIAHRLIEEPVFENPTVLMLVDRNELEMQLFGNLASLLGIGHVEVADSKRYLRELLALDTRGLIVSMIHKFDDIAANINTRSNIFVLVDEAHRTTGGDLGNYLVGALPNATYLGFTGTPIDKTAHGKGTFKVFGSDDAPHGYLDKYSIAESIHDGTTVPLYYALAPNELQVDRETLNREFLDLADAEGVSDFEDLDRVLDRAVTLRNMLKNRDRVRQVAQYVAKHYVETVEPMGYKAFLVGVDREACCLLKEALDNYLAPEYSKVVISAAQNDPPAIARYHLAEDEEKRIRKDFIRSDQAPKILIVTEKLLTGYDAPVLYCMYLDKPMRDHVLLQAIARVNRPYEDELGARKPGGFVLDFVGIFDNLEKALAFDSKDVEATVQGLDVLKQRFETLIERGRDEYLPVIEGKEGDKAADAALAAFLDEEKRHEFYRFFKELEDLYEIISPDVFLRDYMYNFGRMADMYGVLRSAYESGEFIDRELTRKTARLVQDYTHAGQIHESVKVYEINEETLKQISDAHPPDNVRIFNLLKSIQQKVEKEGIGKPYLLSIGERAEKIAEAFKLRQVSTEEALEQLELFINEINEAEREQAKLRVSMEAFSVFWVLKDAGVELERAKEVMDNIADTFEEHPYWKSSTRQEREVRLALYRNFKVLNIKDMTVVVDHILTILRKANNG